MNMIPNLQVRSHQRATRSRRPRLSDQRRLPPGRRVQERVILIHQRSLLPRDATRGQPAGNKKHSSKENDSEQIAEWLLLVFL
jgi:hypothetical protein